MNGKEILALSDQFRELALIKEDVNFKSYFIKIEDKRMNENNGSRKVFVQINDDIVEWMDLLIKKYRKDSSE